MVKTFCVAALVAIDGLEEAGWGALGVNSTLGVCPEGASGIPAWCWGVVLGVRGTPCKLVVLVGGVG